MKETKGTLLKVLMTADTIGGVWTYCMDLCRAMEPSGVFFYLVTMGNKLNETQNVEISGLKNVHLIETTYALEWMQEPWKDVDESGKWLLDIEAKLKPNIIHINGYCHAALPFKAPVISVAHSDVFSWWSNVKGDHPDTDKWTTYLERVKEGVRSADLIIAPSETMLGYINDIYGQPVRSKVIYNGRNVDLFTPEEKQPYIFSAGRVWDEAKNMTLLMKAAPAVNCQVKIAGENSFDDSRIDVPVEHIDFLGKLSQKEIAQQLSHASIYVLPAKYEPFGLSALEAALSGCALVLGDIPSLREIWKNNAIYIDTNDVHSLSAVLNRLLEDTYMRKHYAGLAYEHARQYTARRMATQYLKAYEELKLEKDILKLKSYLNEHRTILSLTT